MRGDHEDRLRSRETSAKTAETLRESVSLDQIQGGTMTYEEHWHSLIRIRISIATGQRLAFLKVAVSNQAIRCFVFVESQTWYSIQAIFKWKIQLL